MIKVGNKRKNNEYTKINKYTYEILVYSEKFGNKIFTIDAEDYEKCKNIHWCIHKSQCGTDEIYFYAKTNDISIKKELLHRFLMNAQKGEIIDHKNKNTLDNRKSNLRKCDKSKNGQNRKKHSNNKSGYTGVTWSKKDEKWMAYIMVKQKFINLGYFIDIEEAAAFRKKAELNYFGEYRNMEQLII